MILSGHSSKRRVFARKRASVCRTGTSSGFAETASVDFSDARNAGPENYFGVSDRGTLDPGHVSRFCCSSIIPLALLVSAGGIIGISLNECSTEYDALERRPYA